jgi:hypothetical protein
MPKPGYPTGTYFPYVGWGFYRQGVTAQLIASRDHFFISYGVFDPYLNNYPAISIGHEGQIFMTTTLQM